MRVYFNMYVAGGDQWGNDNERAHANYALDQAQTSYHMAGNYATVIFPPLMTSFELGPDPRHALLGTRVATSA
jgi:hypothetical protein